MAILYALTDILYTNTVPKHFHLVNLLIYNYLTNYQHLIFSKIGQFESQFEKATCY
jgi:hypothetical protein